MTLPVDPRWPRAGCWQHTSWQHLPAEGSAPSGELIDLAIVGVPTWKTSLSPTGAHATPAAIRAALHRYSEHVVDPGTPSTRGVEPEYVLSETLNIVDMGDLHAPDSVTGQITAVQRITQLASVARVVVALGGDNALTVPVAQGVFAGVAGVRQVVEVGHVAQLRQITESAGLITIDAHHDVRDGNTNGAPVRRLIEAGLNPKQIVQIGISDFANSASYRARAREYGITVIHREEFETRTIEAIAAEALHVAGSGNGPIHVDIDVDVCDRSVAPACPASLPGGISAWQLRKLTRLLAENQQVRGFDIAEVDSLADAADGRTVRLAALCVLEIAAGVTERVSQ